ncbi:MAG: N-acetylglucosamine-6-phosphate deacetylase [Phormidesmis sp.]
MSDSTVILNARLLQYSAENDLAADSGLYQIAIEDALIRAIAPMDTVRMAASSDLDVGGDWISAGAVDLQINGALGLAFPDLRPDHFEQLQAICELLWLQGVDGFCPTLVTTSLENFHGGLAAIHEFQRNFQRDQCCGSAKILGVHLEGPFLNPAKRGAHPEGFLQPLTLENVKTLIGDFAETLSIVTLAPELEAEDEVIEWLCDRHITVSLGHSLATAEQANRAFARGATMVTHAFNAMPGLHHREPGLLGAALSNPDVFCGFIADGQHICPPMLDLLIRSGRGSLHSLLGNLFLVSDALSPLGLPAGLYPWDARQIEVVKGTARLADGTLSGTTLPLIEGAINLVKWGICSLGEAIALATQAPRQAIGLPGLAAGSPAQLLRWHQDSRTDQITWQRLSFK